MEVNFVATLAASGIGRFTKKRRVFLLKIRKQIYEMVVVLVPVPLQCKLMCTEANIEST